MLLFARLSRLLLLKYWFTLFLRAFENSLSRVSLEENRIVLITYCLVHILSDITINVPFEVIINTENLIGN
mgnify:CR=1 FL=1